MFEDKPTQFDYPVIDMDCHIVEPLDIFNEFLDPKYRDQFAATAGQWMLPVGMNDFARGDYRPVLGSKYRMHLESDEAFELNMKDRSYQFLGANDGEARIRAMDEEGIDSGIVRHTFMAYRAPDINLENALCQAYNNWVHNFCSADPNRLFPEALLPVDDMDVALKELDRVAAMGFKGVTLGSSMQVPQSLSSPYWDPLFARMQEMGWPLCIHGAIDMGSPGAHRWLLELFPDAHSGAAYQSIWSNLAFMFDNIITLGEITLGGMCDKFPNLNVYFIESGDSWAGEVLYRLDKAFTCPLIEYSADIEGGAWPFESRNRGTTLPSEIFERQIYLPYEGGNQKYMSNMGMTALSKNLIWASDIPHWDADGPWEGAGALRALKVSEEAERAIMGGNAARMLDIPYQKRVGTSPASKAPAA